MTTDQLFIKVLYVFVTSARTAFVRIAALLSTNTSCLSREPRSLPSKMMDRDTLLLWLDRSIRCLT